MMGPASGPLVLCLLTVSIKVSVGYTEALAANVDVPFTRPDPKFVPMIASLCNKPTMHITPTGWVADLSTDCLKEPKKMLHYCQQLYPNLTITNIVEEHDVTIENWPDKSGRKSTHTVQPYRCVVGDFESDALLVPQHCEFFHEHNICDTYSHWGNVAQRRCKEKKMRIDDFSMLLSCGIDRFKGVEYVCCPKKEKVIDKPVELKPVKKNKKVIKLEDDKYDAYKAYLRGDEQFLRKFGNEHRRFKAAMKAMESRNHARITKMMKEWQEAREHVNTLKKTDPKAAEKLNTEILQRFQKLYNGYQQADAAEKKELIALHLQHRQGFLNSKKREELERYMEELQKKHVKPHRVLKHLEHYIRVEEKDRLQSLNHFTHLKKMDPQEAKRVQSQVGEHMKVIDERISQSLDMLHHFPSIETKIKPQLEKFRKQYDGLAVGARDVVLRPIIIPQNTDSHSNEAPKWTNQVDKIEESKPVEDDVVEDAGFDQETMEDEHQVFVAHQAVDQSQFQQHSFTSGSSRNASVASIFGIAIGSVAVFVIIIVAIIMLRKRTHRHPVTHGFVEVDPAASPEERHVANMQMNGYENPTYKYFELNTNSKN